MPEPNPADRAAQGPAGQPAALPQQKAITDDEPVAVKPRRWLRALKRAGTALLVLAALALGYLFLLLGEPSKEAATSATPAPEEVIAVPMAGVEARSDEDIPTLAASFAKPVLTLQGELTLQKATLYDTAFSGGYARKVTFVYAFADGQTLAAESIRPVAAATLLGGGGYSLSVNQRYTLAGMDAVRMDSGTMVCVFAKGEGAVYAITCPKSHQDELAQLLAGAVLMLPVTGT